MEDNTQPTVPPAASTPGSPDSDEGLTDFLNFTRRETVFSSPRFQLRSVSSMSSALPPNHMYFHPPRRRTATDLVLTHSLMDRGGVKNVLSAAGREDLREELYAPGKFMNEVCPITQESFTEGDSIVVLPCDHCFFPPGIKKWLEDSKAECPVCRRALSSKEVRNTIDEEDQSMPGLAGSEEEDDAEEGYAPPAAHGLRVDGYGIAALNPALHRMLENLVQRSAYSAAARAHVPSVEGPSVEEPSAEGPSVEGPSVEGPSVEGPSVGFLGVSSMLVPNVEGPSVEGPNVEGPNVEGPSVEGPQCRRTQCRRT